MLGTTFFVLSLQKQLENKNFIRKKEARGEAGKGREKREEEWKKEKRREWSYGKRHILDCENVGLNRF